MLKEKRVKATNSKHGLKYKKVQKERNGRIGMNGTNDTKRLNCFAKKETNMALRHAAYLVELKMGQIVDDLVAIYLKDYLAKKKDEAKAKAKQKIIPSDFLWDEGGKSDLHPDK